VAKKKTAVRKKTRKKTRAKKDAARLKASTVQQKQSFPIVGIGASAGGLEAIEAFLKTVPLDSGMAFVLIQHLDPTHKSILTDLVKRVTPMSVHEVTDGLRVQPNSVYVIPPNRDMSILHGTLQLIEPAEPRGLRLPIDFFFRSLAQDMGEHAIAIVLSGTGTDGVLGLRAVKGVGGMVLVQQPETAKYDGMPRSAMATGMVDDVLPPAKLFKRLKSYVKHIVPGGRSSTVAQVDKRQHLNKIFVLLRNQTGHDFSYYKPTTILRRIERRMNINQIETLPDYVRYLQRNRLEVETLFKELLIGVSNFFRDPEAFEVLKKEVIPALFQGRPLDKAIRVWVPGCATGEEAYSIAMLLREHMDSLGQEYKLQVFATDIDSNAIESARSGIYPVGIAVDVPEAYLRRFFTRHENTYHVSKSVRDILIFSEQNLIKDPPFSRLDLISCRNLLIYLEGILQKRILPLFHYALRGDGFLFLGNSETIGDATELFSIMNRKWKIFRRRGGVLPQAQVVHLTPAPFPVDLGGGEQDDAERLPVHVPTSREITERLLLSDYAPASVLISEKGEGLYFHGETGKYLQPPKGEADWNIVGLARKGLQLDLSTALRKVITHKKPVRFEKVPVRSNGDIQHVDLTVRPVPELANQGNALLVVFEDVEGENAGAQEGIIEPSLAADQRVAELERELRANREYLQTTIEELETSNEELKSTNEEMQSANEELQSTNEELETSKEELQSVNEELVTVNTEHEIKLSELSKAHDDMTNLLASTDVGTIFLGMDLHIQRFTPTVTRIINLIESDIDRPLGDISTRLQDVDLVSDAKRVLDTLEPGDREVRTNEGDSYSVRIRPYRTTENVIQGVVITFVDISRLKRVETTLHEMQELHRLILQHISEAVFITDDKGQWIYVCPTVDTIFGYTENEVWTMDNINGLLGDMAFTQKNLTRKGELTNIERRITDKQGRSHDLLISVKRVDIKGGSTLYTCRDVTNT